jgi:hypothetical protein
MLSRQPPRSLPSCEAIVAAFSMDPGLLSNADLKQPRYPLPSLFLLLLKIDPRISPGYVAYAFVIQSC